MYLALWVQEMWALGGDRKSKWVENRSIYLVNKCCIYVCTALCCLVYREISSGWKNNWLFSPIQVLSLPPMSNVQYVPINSIKHKMAAEHDCAGCIIKHCTCVVSLLAGIFLVIFAYIEKNVPHLFVSLWSSRFTSETGQALLLSCQVPPTGRHTGLGWPSTTW